MLLPWLSLTGVILLQRALRQSDSQPVSQHLQIAKKPVLVVEVKKGSGEPGDLGSALAQLEEFHELPSGFDGEGSRFTDQHERPVVNVCADTVIYSVHSYRKFVMEYELAKVIAVVK